MYGFGHKVTKKEGQFPTKEQECLKGMGIHARLCGTSSLRDLPSDILLAKRLFCLHLHFGATRENRLKSSRWHFSTPRGFSLLRTLSADTERVINHQNERKMLFCHAEMTKRPAFSPNSACFDSEFPQAENPTPHAEIVIPARGVGNRPTRRRHFRLVSRHFSLLRKVTD